MSLLAVQTLHAGYGADEILHGISLTVKPGEIVTIIGPNGSGKSTCIKAILGYVRITRGTVFFQQEDITRFHATHIASLGIGYVPQLRNIFTPLTVLENLEMGGYRLSKRQMASALERIFTLFPLLQERRKQKAGTLSGGERQLLAMARALMVSPSLLFLDEPSAGLSPIATAEIFSHIATISTLGTAVVIVEQEAQQSLAISQRGYVFVMGAVAFTGPAQAILGDKRIQRAYLGGKGIETQEGEYDNGEGHLP
jgi:ABC-type branched-subunit amino acid transport system ATPase component